MTNQKLTREEQEKLNEELFGAIENNNLNCVKKVVKTGADINAKNKYGNSVLHRSIFKDTKKIKYLLEAGADPNIQDNNGNTALHETIYWNRLDAVEFLLKHRADMYIKNNKGETAYTLSVIRGYWDTAKLFVSYGYVPSKEEIQNINNRRLFEAIEKDNLFEVKKAVEDGADVNIKDKYGKYVLHKSICQSIEITKYLLEAGANPNIRDNNGCTLLIFASTFRNFYKAKPLLQLLLKYNADMYIKDDIGETPYVKSNICGYKDIAELFISHGYVPSKEDIQNINNGKMSNAIESNDLSEVKKAVEDGADVNAKNHQGYHFLYQSVYCFDTKITEYLLKLGADPNIQDKDNWTALHGAAEQGRIEHTKLLLKHGADMYIKNKDNHTPFAKCFSYGRSHYLTAELFVMNGYVPTDEDFQTIKDETERKSLKTRFMTLAAQVQEQRKKLKEEAEATEFINADEIIEM